MSPAAQADACGNGVAVIGSGSTATCDNTQTASTSGNDGNSANDGNGSLVDVSPAAQADACGNGVAVIGSGSTATCDNAQSLIMKDPSMIGIFPAIEGEICGNGVAVIGSGSTATCDNSQNASTGGNGGTSNLVDVSPAAQVDVVRQRRGRHRLRQRRHLRGLAGNR